MFSFQGSEPAHSGRRSLSAGRFIGVIIPMKKLSAVLLSVFLLVSLLSACGDNGTVSTSAPASSESQVYKPIQLNGDTISYSGKGAVASGNVITITDEGEYHVTGTLTNGQIIVDTSSHPDAGKVFLFLDNADITCLTAPAIYVLQADTLHLVLSEGTENRLTSGTREDYDNYDGTANGGAIFAEDDVDIEGTGGLEIYGYINNGISCKDDVDIEGGTLSILAANNGIKGSESVSLLGGSVSVVSQNDGIKATSADKEGKGFILVDGCDVAVTCISDGLSAETDLTVNSGSVTVISTGDPLANSCKAIKAKTGLVINGGSLNLSSADHALHSTSGIDINGGEITAVSTAGKAIAAHANISITGGSLALTAFDDGIETESDISISGGTISILAEGNGIRSGEKSDGISAATGVITISDGVLTIDALSNPLNARSSLVINGGTVLGTGASGKVKTVTGSQAAVSSSFAGAADSELSVSGTGADLTMQVTHKFTEVLFSTPEMVSGSEYAVSAGSASASLTA